MNTYYPFRTERKLRYKLSEIHYYKNLTQSYLKTVYLKKYYLTLTLIATLGTERRNDEGEY